MGKSSQGIHGGFTGRVGNIVGSQLRGKQVLRIRPASVANPNTEKQRSQRDRFGMVNRFLSSQSALVKIGFRSFSARQSAFNAAASYNLKNAVIGVFPEVQLSYADLKLSKGNLPALSGLTMAFTAPDTLSLQWTDNSSRAFAAATDVLMVGLYDADKAEGMTFMNCGIRADGTASLELPEEWLGRTAAVFAFFLSAAGLGGIATKDQVSDSVFGGSIALSV